jgi:hypothetical protein
VATVATQFLALVLPLAVAAADFGSARPPETYVGTEGVYHLRHRGPPLAVRALDDRAALALRIAATAADRDTTLYELRYIGARPGRYDLSQYVERVDGAPAALEAMVVDVRGILPAEHDGSLRELAAPTLPTYLPYRPLLVAVGGFWLVALLWLIARRVRRRQRPAAPTPAAAAPEDPLLALIEQALAGRLSASKLARLEMLILAEWRRRLDLEQCSLAEARRRMRSMAEADDLVEWLDRWLYQRPGIPFDDGHDLRRHLDPLRASAGKCTVGEARS